MPHHAPETAHLAHVANAALVARGYFGGVEDIAVHDIVHGQLFFDRQAALPNIADNILGRFLFGQRGDIALLTGKGGECREGLQV